MKNQAMVNVMSTRDLVANPLHQDVWWNMILFFWFRDAKPRSCLVKEKYINFKLIVFISPVFFYKYHSPRKVTKSNVKIDETTVLWNTVSVINLHRNKQEKEKTMTNKIWQHGSSNVWDFKYDSPKWQSTN